jgi:hypothetical protein
VKGPDSAFSSSSEYVFSQGDLPALPSVLSISLCCFVTPTCFVAPSIVHVITGAHNLNALLNSVGVLFLENFNFHWAPFLSEKEKD